MVLAGAAVFWPLTGSNEPSWRQAATGEILIQSGPRTSVFTLGVGDRLRVPDAPEFHVGAGQDFSLAAWIEPLPITVGVARELAGWFGRHPTAARLVPTPLANWIQTHSVENAFGVTPIVDKHQTPNIVSAVGFLFYLDHGRLACLLSDSLLPEHRAVFAAAGPDLVDGRWHHVALTVQRHVVTGGKLYVDGRAVLTFDPTHQAGDLSNAEPLRLGNHANPSLSCFFRGRIGGLALYRRALTADEITARCQAGPPRR